MFEVKVLKLAVFSGVPYEARSIVQHDENDPQQSNDEAILDIADERNENQSAIVKSRILWHTPIHLEIDSPGMNVGYSKHLFCSSFAYYKCLELGDLLCPLLFDAILITMGCVLLVVWLVLGKSEIIFEPNTIRSFRLGNMLLWLLIATGSLSLIAILPTKETMHRCIHTNITINTTHFHIKRSFRLRRRNRDSVTNPREYASRPSCLERMLLLQPKGHTESLNRAEVRISFHDEISFAIRLLRRSIFLTAMHMDIVFCAKDGRNIRCFPTFWISESKPRSRQI